MASSRPTPLIMSAGSVLPYTFNPWHNVDNLRFPRHSHWLYFSCLVLLHICTVALCCEHLYTSLPVVFIVKYRCNIRSLLFLSSFFSSESCKSYAVQILQLHYPLHNLLLHISLHRLPPLPPYTQVIVYTPDVRHQYTRRPINLIGPSFLIRAADMGPPRSVGACTSGDPQRPCLNWMDPEQTKAITVFHPALR